MHLGLASCSDDSPTDTPNPDPTNTAPEISSITSDPTTVGIGLSSSITCSAIDLEIDDLSYVWSSTAGAITGSGATITWTAPSIAGTYSITCNVSDGDDTSSDSINVVVFEPVVPGTMVLVQGGTFPMGDSHSSGSIEEIPVHSVTLGDYLMGKYEVTQAEWAQYMTASVYDASFPTWNAVECNWSANGYRLPTEAEWEYAARGGSQAVDDVAWSGNNAPISTQSIGTKISNQLGLYDMSGNIYEFCWDWFGEDYYTTCHNLGTVTDPVGVATGEMRVVRGGSWGGDAANCRVAGRFRDYPVSAFSHSGFRLVRQP